MYTDMDKTLRRQLEYAKVWENTVTALAGYLEKYGFESMVLGISGGIDSTVVAAIAYEVHRRIGKPLIGLSLMTSTNESCEVTAADYVGCEFCTEFYKREITKAYKSVLSQCCDISEVSNRTSVADGNIKARLRMIMLYDTASIRHGIVLDTDNISEHQLGFWTIHGDESDLSVIAGLWKHEVYEFAQWILDNKYPASLALKESIVLVPTDGNGVQTGGDMAQIAPGRTYDDVDDILMTYLEYSRHHPEEYQTAMDELNTKYGADTVERVIKRHLNSKFKRYHRPFTISTETGEILQNDGRPLFSH